MLGPRPNVNELLLAFIAFEEREGLFDRRLHGVAYWPLVRHDVFRETLESLGLAERAHLRVEELPMRHWFGSQLLQLPKTLQRSRLTHAPRADLLIAAHPRHVPYQGMFVCPYSQPLLWGTARSRVLLEGHFQGRYFEPDAGEITRYVDLALVRAHAEFRARELRGAGLTPRDRSEVHSLVESLRRALGSAPEPAAVFRRVRTAVLTALGLTPQLTRLLDAVRPKLIVVVVGYRLVNQLLTQVARSRGIVVAELQHGTLGAGHAGYNFASGRRPTTFPDYLLLFGDLWRTAAPGLPLPAERTPAIGYGWLDLHRTAAHAHTERSTIRRVLFLSQRGVGRELAKLAAALSQLLPAHEFELVFRLHPSEGIGWEQAYPELTSSGVRVERAAERALYASQDAAQVQVGVYSTALLEGLAFGLETFLVELPGHEQLAMLSAAGLARTVANAEALAVALRATPTARSSIDNTGGEALWARGAAANFARFVERIVG
jgi:hypothetical protein